MNEHQLSKRLAEVAALVPAGSRLADIGTDHAYLPIHLILQGKICTAIAGDINPGPYQSAVQQVERLSLQSVIEVRMGNGLEVVESGEVDVICIAGMGGALIAQILSEGQDKLNKVKRLILQPNVAGNFVREWLLDNQWELKKETMIEEDGKYYEILMAERGNPDAPYENLNAEDKAQALLMGPYLLAEKPKAFIQKWQSEIEKRVKILHSLSQAEGEDKELRIQTVQKEIEMIEKGIEA